MKAAFFPRAVPGLALLLAALLVGCAPEPPGGANTASPAPTVDGERFLIECVEADGGVIGTFTRLEEAWASTNYLRIDHCEASPATSDPVELSPEEQSVAETASADLPDEDAVQLFLLTLSTCVRVTPTGDRGLPTLPTSLLRATLELCPDAPHAGLVENELESRTG